MDIKSKDYGTLKKGQQAQMLRLVTASFCRELARYGVDQQEMINVSVQLLDYAMHTNGGAVPAAQEVHTETLRKRISESWAVRRSLVYHEVELVDVAPEHLPVIGEWLSSTDVQRNFAVRFPTAPDELRRHLLETLGHQYFCICHRGRPVGMIGGEHMDHDARKVEMKKFIGDAHFRGRGIAKKATYLWLFYVFEVLRFNKVYIYSLDTNIRNINLNCVFGFELEGVLVQDAHQDGVYKDVVRMSLVRSRWETIVG